MGNGSHRLAATEPAQSATESSAPCALDAFGPFFERILSEFGSIAGLLQASQLVIQRSVRPAEAGLTSVDRSEFCLVV